MELVITRAVDAGAGVNYLPNLQIIIGNVPFPN